MQSDLTVGGVETTEADVQAAQQKKQRGERTAENIRYGQNLSQHGYGGETTANNGTSVQGKHIIAIMFCRDLPIEQMALALLPPKILPMVLIRELLRATERVLEWVREGNAHNRSS